MRKTGNAGRSGWLAVGLLAGAIWARAEAPVTRLEATAWRQLITSNYLLEAYADLAVAQHTNLTREADAAGGCDGVINGGWGFHTGEDATPWWQVDLQQIYSLGQVVIWNRTDAAERARELELYLSLDGQQWRRVYAHDGRVFKGHADRKPLDIKLNGERGRYVRVQLPARGFLHLDEVEVFAVGHPRQNVALGRPASQSSISRWSRNNLAPQEPDWRAVTERVHAYCRLRLAELRQEGVDTTALEAQWQRLLAEFGAAPARAYTREHYVAARWVQRQIVLANPLLNFDTLVFNKRAPASFNHMSDQYYGWWSKPGGGIYLLRHFKSETPEVICLTTAFTAPGSFLRPTLSYDGRKILFAWCRYYPHLHKETNKLDKANVPEDAFYHLFEMNVDGSGLRQLTFGKYDDFDGRYLPDGRIVFLSTRRGQALQVNKATARQSVERAAQPDIYVRCGGGPERPVAVYTLHTMKADGSDLTAISPFEMFEWTPEIGHDGAILYSRWDYVDRDNMPYMGLWAMNPDGTNPRVVYGNYTVAPHCAFEPKPVPNSRKIVFTASGHHSQTMGSLVLLDPSVGTEGPAPITRLTPEVPMPEVETWPKTYYASPWPLSERFYLVAWSFEGVSVPGPEGWERWHAVQRPDNSMSLYLYDAMGSRELIYRDPLISSLEPIPLRPRSVPPVLASQAQWDVASEGRFLLTDVYQGLQTVRRGDIKALRVVAIPPKTHPTMDYPNMGLTKDDPGKLLLGTVPVEADGSAYFRAPAGVIVFFQALDERGLAVQTMRSAAHVQPGQTLSCAGCHEHRSTAPASRRVLAALREPSRLTPGPEGTWPLRFDQLIQPMLNRDCVGCHSPTSVHGAARKINLTPEAAYEQLTRYGKPSLLKLVKDGYARGYSIEGEGVAQRSALLQFLQKPDTPCGKPALTPADWERWVVWMDLYAQRRGAFDEQQERELRRYRQQWADLLQERPSVPAGQLSSR
ncbi:MAG: discoidin domain-containing protein [Verrucomicrobiae bacterium]|nr:discoidin domain-containing protein [Verrucomicrobiae bacterium]